MTPAIERVVSELESLAAEAPGRQKENGMVSPADGKLLRLLVETSGAKSVLEIGSGVGAATLHLALGLVKTGGRLVTWEGLPSKAAACRQAVARAGLSGIVDSREGDFRDAESEPGRTFDFVFSDAMKTDNLLYFDRFMPRVSVGGLIVAHDALGGENAKMRDYLDMLKEHPCLDTVFVSPESRVGAGDARGGAGLAISRKTSGRLDAVHSWARHRAKTELRLPPRRERGTLPAHETLLSYPDDYGCQGSYVIVPGGAKKEDVVALCRELLAVRGLSPFISIHVFDDRAAFAHRDDFDFPAADYFKHLVAQISRHPRQPDDEIRYFPEGLTLLSEKPRTEPISPHAVYGASPETGR